MAISHFTPRKRKNSIEKSVIVLKLSKSIVADIVRRYNDELVLEIIKDTCISVIEFTIGSFMKTFESLSPFPFLVY